MGVEKMLIDIRTIAEQLVVAEADRMGSGGRMVPQLKKSVHFLEKVEQHTQKFISDLDLINHYMARKTEKVTFPIMFTMLEVKQLCDSLIADGIFSDYNFNEKLIELANNCSKAERTFLHCSDQIRLQIVCTKADYLTRFFTNY
jgi:hypothetical protein